MEENTQKMVHKSIRFPADFWSRLEVEASKADLPTSEFVRTILEERLTQCATSGWIPGKYWQRWNTLAQAAESSSALEWLETIIQERLSGRETEQPIFDQKSFESRVLAQLQQSLERQSQSELRHIELSATLETFVLLRLWLEKQQPDLIVKAHQLAGEHYQRAKSRDMLPNKSTELELA